MTNDQSQKSLAATCLSDMVRWRPSCRLVAPGRRRIPLYFQFRAGPGHFFICYLLFAICYSPVAGIGYALHSHLPRQPSHFQTASPATGTGEKIFQTRCFVCHGRDGRGLGPASQGLPQKPQDLTDPSWQQNVTNDQIRSVIRAGGAILGKSGAMPPNPDLTDDDLNSLVAYVRHLAATP